MSRPMPMLELTAALGVVLVMSAGALLVAAGSGAGAPVAVIGWVLAFGFLMLVLADSRPR